MDLLRQKVESDHQSLRKTLDTLNDSMSKISGCLQEHKEQTTVELARLQTSFISTQASLANQTGQLNNKLDSHTKHSSQLNNKLDSLSSKLNTLNSIQSSNAMQLDNKLNDMSSKANAHLSNITERQQQTTAELAQLQTALTSTKSSLAKQTGQLNNKLDSHANHSSQLNNKLDSLSSKLDTLDTSLSQHQQQNTAELVHLQTSLNSTNSKLHSLTANAAQLSSDHQEIQTNISDMQCMDTQQSLQLHQNLHNNLTHQLKKIKNDVTFIRGPYTCGGTRGWRRVVYLDMTHPCTTCPCGWNMTGYSKRTCGRNSTEFFTCSSATFPVSGGEYNRICGRVKAYQWGSTRAFDSYHSRQVTTIDGAYASGVSVTHGTPRNHIWSFVAGLSEGNPSGTIFCPCDTTSTIRIPPFVGNDYFCESGVNEPWDNNRHFTFHPSDTLWDGGDCLPSSTCCSQHNPPYFTKQLPTPTTDDIESRICLYNSLQYANVAVELVELYVQ